MEKVLITGGAGFIASCLADALLATGKYHVVCVDNLLTGKVEFLSKHQNYMFIECDVNNVVEFRNKISTLNVDYIFHYAAVVGVARTTTNPKLVMDDIIGLQQIFEFARTTQVKRIFFSSSSEVYGEPVHLPQHEYSTPLNSRLPYAVVKNIGECFCKTFQQEYGLDYTIFRFFNTYGPRQSNDFVITKFIHLARSGGDITMYGDGTQTRTFCYIDDNIDFTLRVLQENLFINDVVNVGDERLITIKELASCIIGKINSTSKMIHVPPLKEGDMERRQPDNLKMKTILDRDLICLEDGISRIINSNILSH